MDKCQIGWFVHILAKLRKKCTHDDRGKGGPKLYNALFIEVLPKSRPADMALEGMGGGGLEFSRLMRSAS